MMKRSSDSAQTVARAAALLDLFAPERRELGVAQVATLLAVPKTTAHRLLATMREAGYLRQTRSGTYAIGAKVLLLARIYVAGQPVRDLARPHMQRVLAATDESVSLYIREGEYRYCLERLECSHSLRVIVPIGSHFPLSIGATGRLLRMEPAQARKDGYVISRGERVPNACAIAAPVFDADGLAAALQITVPQARADEAKLRTFGDILMEHAAALSRELGDPLT